MKLFVIRNNSSSVINLERTMSTIWKTNVLEVENFDDMIRARDVVNNTRFEEMVTVICLEKDNIDNDKLIKLLETIKYRIILITDSHNIDTIAKRDWCSLSVVDDNFTELTLTISQELDKKKRYSKLFEVIKISVSKPLIHCSSLFRLKKKLFS